MSITDKTRKILWARSGNRCAICRKELVVDASDRSDESIVGEECHIFSNRPLGPRHDSTLSSDKIDAIENVILLCRIHHKMVDDQFETYTVLALREIKLGHESWVSKTLEPNSAVKPVRIVRVRSQIPKELLRLSNGREIAVLVYNGSTFSFDHTELTSPEEVELVGGFLQAVQDYGELLSPASEAHEFVQANTALSALLKDLEDGGFCAYGARELQRIEGGVQAEPGSWINVIVRVVRKKCE